MLFKICSILQMQARQNPRCPHTMIQSLPKCIVVISAVFALFVKNESISLYLRLVSLLVARLIFPSSSTDLEVPPLLFLPNSLLFRENDGLCDTYSTCRRLGLGLGCMSAKSRTLISYSASEPKLFVLYREFAGIFVACGGGGVWRKPESGVGGLRFCLRRSVVIS